MNSLSPSASNYVTILIRLYNNIFHLLPTSVRPPYAAVTTTILLRHTRPSLDCNSTTLRPSNHLQWKLTCSFLQQLLNDKQTVKRPSAWYVRTLSVHASSSSTHCSDVTVKSQYDNNSQNHAFMLPNSHYRKLSRSQITVVITPLFTCKFDEKFYLLPYYRYLYPSLHNSYTFSPNWSAPQHQWVMILFLLYTLISTH